jgi:hypothetical protein
MYLYAVKQGGYLFILLGSTPNVDKNTFIKKVNIRGVYYLGNRNCNILIFNYFLILTKQKL